MPRGREKRLQQHWPADRLVLRPRNSHTLVFFPSLIVPPHTFCPAARWDRGLKVPWESGAGTFGPVFSMKPCLR